MVSPSPHENLLQQPPHLSKCGRLLSLRYSATNLLRLSLTDGMRMASSVTLA